MFKYHAIPSDKVIKFISLGLNSRLIKCKARYEEEDLAVEREREREMERGRERKKMRERERENPSLVLT